MLLEAWERDVSKTMTISIFSIVCCVCVKMSAICCVEIQNHNGYRINRKCIISVESR